MRDCIKIIHILKITYSIKLCKHSKSRYNKRVKIGIYDPYLDDLGGGEKYMMKIAQCFSQNNEGFVFWNEEEDFDDLKKDFLLIFQEWSLRNNIFSKNFPIWKRLIESKRYDVIILLSDGSAYLSFYQKKLIFIFSNHFLE